MKKLYILASAIFGLASIQQSSAQCNGRYQTDIYSVVDTTFDIQYGSNTDLANNPVNLMMDIYQPQGDTASMRPLIIFAHGGSFISGDKSSGEIAYLATEFAKKGYVCASISYRLAPNAFYLVTEENTVKVVFGAIQDGKAAIRYFRKDAATTNTYKINPDQIFIGGTSAGGILGINLTYMDDVNKLSPQWKSWANDIGGLEGASGNPGYCSRSNGTFGFAGAIADTSWVDANDVPWYGSHAQNDQTVKYGYGKPLNGNNPVDLFGSSLIEVRLSNLGIYNHFDSYSGGDHPPFANSTTILQDNKDSLTMFLYNILDCNPNNMQSANQKNCATHPTAINDLANNKLVNKIYPNPFNDAINIELNDINNASVTIFNTMGQIILQEKITTHIYKINLDNLNAGAYFVKVTANNESFSQTVVKK
mgnify:CR=1 FL=1